MPERTIIHIDPAIGSTNLGDEIISDAVSSQIMKIFPQSRIIKISSRDIGLWAKKQLLDKADLILFGGSNALSSDPVFGYRQFAMGKIPPFYLNNIVLLGVGWWQYQEKNGFLSKPFYKKVLDNKTIHSVRDSYSKEKLNHMGFENIQNTSCPTMWDLTSFENTIDSKVIFTITDYHPNHVRDTTFIKNITAKFSDICFWPQGTGDVEYLKKLSNEIDMTKIKILKPNLRNFDERLEDNYSYIGTRLHAGIRALQKKCPSYIIPVDNRAVEIAKTESLPLVSNDLAELSASDKYQYKHIKNPDIQKFINQFSQN
jgi:polysaccharide pyruvyl transferase WcaK-like protein